MESFESIDAIVANFYRIVSGPAGREIDWQSERRMYHPGARLMRTGVNEEQRPRIQAMTVDQFIEDTAPFFATNDFYEYEIGRRVDRFGDIAQIRSAYEAKSHPDADRVLKRGVNLIQLYHDGSRWWVTAVIWGDERPGIRLPDDWLEPG